MKYYIILSEQSYTLFKVADNLVTSFQKEHKEKVIAEGRNILETLTNFENVDNKIPEFSLSEKPEKYKIRQGQT